MYSECVCVSGARVRDVNHVMRAERDFRQTILYCVPYNEHSFTRFACAAMTQKCRVFRRGGARMAKFECIFDHIFVISARPSNCEIRRVGIVIVRRAVHRKKKHTA